MHAPCSFYSCALFTCLFAGFDVVPYRQLAGILSSCFKQGAQDVGGPITQALRETGGRSTSDRLACAEASIERGHKEALRAARAPAELARQRTLWQKQRSLSPRHPLYSLLRLPAGQDVLVGLGTGPEVPRVLQFNGKIKYKYVIFSTQCQNLLYFRNIDPMLHTT